MELLIIDMQLGLFSDETPRFDANGVVDRINRLSKAIRQQGGNVIFIQHDGPEGDGLEPGTPGWAILPGLDRIESDPVIRKKACDSFYETELRNLLDKHNSREIITTGCATDFCVDTTIRSAASNGFDVVVASDCHTTADRPHLDAQTIIQHHNFVWENFIHPKSKVRVVSSDELIKEIQETGGE